MTTLDYRQFAERCIAELKTLQDEFQEQYNLSEYQHWFYNQYTGLLTFNTGKTELNFRYFDAGSFSKRSCTWKWSWDNEETLQQAKQPTALIKAFGAESVYPRLITGCFDSNEFEAWELAAIAVKLTNGIGVYRPVDEENELHIFLVVMECIDNEMAQDIKDRYVTCSMHEYGRRAFVCQHLDLDSKVGFEEAFETTEDMELMEGDDFQAWCNTCELVRQKEGGWNERSEAFADIKLICEKCYFEIKKLNLSASNGLSGSL